MNKTIPGLPGRVFELLTSAFQKFRFQLSFVILLSTFFPLLLTGWIVFKLSTTALRELAVGKHQAVLDAVAGGTELFIRNHVTKLGELAEDPLVQSLSWQNSEPVFREFLVRNRFFHDLILVQAPNRLVGLSRRHSRKDFSKYFGMNLNEINLENVRQFSDLFDATLNEKNSAAIGQKSKSTNSGKMLLVIPVHNFMENNEIIGALGAQANIDGTDIQGIINAFPYHGREYVCVLNRQGTILARRGIGLSPTARALSLPDFSDFGKALGPKTLTFEIQNDSREDLLSLTFSPLLDGFIGFGQPAQEAFVLVHRLQENFWVIVAIALVISLAGSFLLGQAVSKPIMNLTEGIQKVGEGVLSYRVPVQGHDELGEASRAINSLAETLQKKHLIASHWEKLKSESEDSK